MSGTTYGSTDALDQAGEEAILDAVAEGDTITVIARRYQLSRRSVYNWINAGGKERRERFEEARRQSAEAMLDKADDILEDERSVSTPQHASIAKEKVSHLRWKATKLDRETYGDKTASGVTINIGSLHLDALRQVGSMTTHQALPSGETVDAELIEEDGA